MAGLARVLALAFIVASPVQMAIRDGTSGNGTVDLELQNVSAKTVESLAEVLLTLRPLDRRGPLFGGTLVSSADAATGRFGGLYAARQSYPPQRHLTTLRLEAGERRTIKLELLSLRWSLGPNWVEQPREFWELAGGGTYFLNALLLVDEYPKMRLATRELSTPARKFGDVLWGSCGLGASGESLE